MTLEAKIERVQELIARRREIELELAALFDGAALPPRKRRVCSTCGQEGHSARTCTQTGGESRSVADRES